MSKVLMFMPTYQVKGVDQIWPDCLESVQALKIPEGAQVDFVIGRDNPYKGGGHKNTLHQYQQARKMALDGGYDVLFTVEHDMILPANALETLWGSSAPVVYGVYVLRHGSNVLNIMNAIPDGPSVGSSLTGQTRELRAAQRRGWCECSGVGFGCTLIRRHVLERIGFRASGESYPPDWGFAVDCQKAHIRQVARFDVICGHIDGDNGLILWPGEDGMDRVRVKILTRFVGAVGDRTQTFTPGQELELPADVAVEYMRAGYLTPIGEGRPAAVKVVAKPRASGKAVKGGDN